MTNRTHEAYKAEVRRTHALLKPISTEAAAIFYPTLFDVDPSTKPLFQTVDMDKQGGKLMKILGVAVLNLDKMDVLRPTLVKLGKKHVSYGVKEEMYPSVVSALLITLEKGLGEECRPETTAAWEWVMTGISAVCIDAAREELGLPPLDRKQPTGLCAAALEGGLFSAVVVGVVAAAVAVAGVVAWGEF